MTEAAENSFERCVTIIMATVFAAHPKPVTLYSSHFVGEDLPESEIAHTMRWLAINHALRGQGHYKTNECTVSDATLPVAMYVAMNKTMPTFSGYSIGQIAQTAAAEGRADLWPVVTSEILAVLVRQQPSP